MPKTISKLKINNKCKKCNSDMIVKEKKTIGKTTYYVLYCMKCKYSCARSE